MSSAVDLDEPSNETETPARTPRSRGDLVRTVIRGIGQTLITIGLVSLLFVVYALYVTDFLASREQDKLSEQIEQQWAGAPAGGAPAAAPGQPAVPESIEVGVGDPFAVLHIPRLGDDFARVVVEGTGAVELSQGPGHYQETAMPGQPGNFSVAGHRVGRGSPFLDLDQMRPGDAIVVETESNWYTYRVLGDPASGDFTTDPSGIPGLEIVRPEQIDVVAATPGGVEATDAYLTLTTCHPKYSARQRLIIHARLEGGVSKASTPDGPPALAG